MSNGVQRVRRFELLAGGVATTAALLIGCSQASAPRSPDAVEHDPLADLIAQSVAPAGDRLRDCYLRSSHTGQTVNVELDYKLSTLGHAVHLTVDSTPASPELELCERRVMEGIVQLPGTVGVDVSMRVQHAPSADAEPDFVVFRNAPPAPDPTLENFFPGIRL